MPIYINKDGQQSGPYEDHIVIDQLKNGTLSPNDLGVRHGESAWQRLDEMFPGVGFSQPEPPLRVAVPVSSVAPVAPVAKKGGGCLKIGLIVVGLMFLLLGAGTAIGSRFIPSVSCNLAESDAQHISKLRADLDKATKDGKFDKIGPLQIQIQEELSGAEVSERYCNDDKFRDNLIAVAGVVLGAVGFLMALIGLFVGRRR